MRIKPFTRKEANCAQCFANFTSVDAAFSATPIEAKIAPAETARVHNMLVIGECDVRAGNVSVRLHSKGPRGGKPKVEVVWSIRVVLGFAVGCGRFTP
jgi:threonyl-tRNA synthetase